MQYPDRRVFRLLLLLLDLGALIAAFQLAVHTRIALNSLYAFRMTLPAIQQLAPPLGLILILWIPMSAWLALYRPRRGAVRGSVAQVIESVAALGGLTIVVTFFIRNFGTGFSRTFVLFFSGFSLLTLLAARGLLAAGLAFCQRRGYAQERLAIAGSGRDAKRLAEHFESSRRLGVKLCGVIVPEPAAAQGVLGNPVPILGTLSDAGGLINAHRLDRILALDSEIDRMGLQTLAAVCTRMGVTLLRLPADVEPQSTRLRVHRIGSLHLLEVRGLQLTRGQEILKRSFDLTAGSLMLALSLPLMLLLGLLVKATSRGPILYVAPRVGKGGRHFRFYKLRSMVAGADALRDKLPGAARRDGHIFKMKEDPRLTRVGRFMRRYSLDELPQLIHVLKGEMSLVGPRPLPAADLDLDGLSREHAFWAVERTRVLPGITGLWQVRGRSDLGFEAMIRHDVAYAREWSLWSDVLILLQTLPAVLRGRGAY